MDNNIIQIVKDTPNDMELGKKIRELCDAFTYPIDKDYLDYWTCDHCGKHTHKVEYDYLGNNRNHLQCELELGI